MKALVMTLIVSLLMISNVSFAYVLNYGFLDDTVGVYFNEKDWQYFKVSQLKALNNTKDGIKSIWKNPQTGSWGSFLPSRSVLERGVRCRDLTIVSAANFRIGQSTLKFCKIMGNWQGV